MPRLIDADALTEDFLNSFEKSDRARDMIKNIQLAPTIDAVPIVRCWYCKNVLLISTGHHRCCKFDVPVAEDDFCSQGERRVSDAAD